MNEPTRNIHVDITVSTIIKGILLIVSAWAVFVLKDIILVILTAVVIASSIEPPIQWLKRKGLPRVLSAVAVYGTVAVLFMGAFYTLLPTLLEDTSEFLSAVPKYIESTTLWNPLGLAQEATVPAEQTVQPVSTFAELTKTASSVVSSGNDFSVRGAMASINEAMSSVSTGFVHSASIVFGGVVSFILIVVLSFYLAVQEDGVEKFLRIITPVKEEKYVIDLWKRTQTKIGLWMQGQLILALLVGILVYLGLMILGVKNALLFAVIAAALETIPLFGPVIAAIPAVAVTFNDVGTTAAIVVAGLYLIIHQFENHLIYPLVVKKIVGVPPILVILALIIGFKLAGFLGIILSVPFASMLVEFLDDVQKSRVSQ